MNTEQISRVIAIQNGADPQELQKAAEPETFKQTEKSTTQTLNTQSVSGLLYTMGGEKTTILLIGNPEESVKQIAN
jgi:hypothetical protein